MPFSDVRWIAKRYVLSIILIVLTQLAESENRNLPNVIDGNYIPLYLVIGIVIVSIFNICRMNRDVRESKLITLQRDRLRFALVTVPGFAFDFYHELLAVVIFFMSLFYFAVGIKNQNIELLLNIFHYFIGLVLAPGLAYLFMRLKRRFFDPLIIDDDSLFCNKILNFCKRILYPCKMIFKIVKTNYIVFSLIVLISLNLVLIQIDP